MLVLAGVVLFFFPVTVRLFWICAEHSDGIRGAFVAAEQGLPRAEAFSPFHIAVLARKLGCMRG